ncbi:hypothetical protein MBR_09431, partial [Metarhizium brunneum ARSEF 3297]
MKDTKNKLPKTTSALPPRYPTLQAVVSSRDETAASDPSPEGGDVLLCTSDAPQMTLQERANAYFMSNYVLDSSNLSNICYTGFSVLLEINKESRHYRLAFEACTMAVFIQETADRRDHRTFTTEEYDKAVVATNAALQDPAIMHKDATLASVLLLALFECINPTTRDQRAWRNHIIGASKLAEDRGCQLRETKTGRALLMAVRTQMIMYHLINLEEWDGHELWLVQDDIVDEYSPTQKLCIEVSSLGRRAKSLIGPQNENDVAREILEQCLDHDQVCKNWWEKMLDNTQRNMKRKRPCSEWGATSDNTGLWLSMPWNMLTCARILLNSIIIRCAACIHGHASYTTTKEFLDAFAILKEILFDDFTTNKRQLSRASEASSSSANLMEEKSLPGFRRHSMAWPIAFIWSLDCLTDDQKTAFAEQIEHIGLQHELHSILLFQNEKTGLPPYMSEDLPYATSRAPGSCCATVITIASSPASVNSCDDFDNVEWNNRSNPDKPPSTHNHDNVSIESNVSTSASLQQATGQKKPETTPLPTPLATSRLDALLSHYENPVNEQVKSCQRHGSPDKFVESPSGQPEPNHEASYSNMKPAGKPQRRISKYGVQGRGYNTRSAASQSRGKKHALAPTLKPFEYKGLGDARQTSNGSIEVEVLWAPSFLACDQLRGKEAIEEAKDLVIKKFGHTVWERERSTTGVKGLRSA